MSSINLNQKQGPMSPEAEEMHRRKQRRERIRRSFIEWLKTPLGYEVLDEMAEEFDDDDLKGSTVEETYFRLGQRDVIRSFRKLRTRGE